MDIASVFDFATPAEQASILARDFLVDVTAPIQAGLATGGCLFTPAGGYRYSDTLKVGAPDHGQRLIGPSRFSPGGVMLRWHGTGGNCIELVSTRRDTGSALPSRTGLGLSGIFMTAGAGSTYQNAVWVEEGVFHSVVDNLYIKNTTGGGYPGPMPLESFMKIEGSITSEYPVHNVFRDIVIQAADATTITAAAPVGLWIESAIEAHFDNVFVYNCEVNWRLGSAAGGRAVINVSLVKCMGETGMRANASGNATAMEIYNAIDVNLIGCKFDAGAGGVAGSAANQRAFRFKNKAGDPVDGFKMNGGIAWGFGAQTDYIIEVESAAEVFNSSFHDVEFLQPGIGIMNVNQPATPEIDFTGSYPRRAAPKFSKFNSKGYRVGAQTVPAASTLVLTATPYSRLGEAPTLASVTNLGTVPAAPVYASSYQTNDSLRQIGAFTLYNPTGAAVSTPSSTTLRSRAFTSDEVAGELAKAATPGLVSNGSQYSTFVDMPGVAFGDFTAAEFFNADLNNRQGLMISSYVTMANRVQCQLLNLTGAARNLSAGTFRIYKLAPKFDFFNSAAYNAPSIADGSFGTVDVTALGANIGDYAVASLSIGLAGVFMYAMVSASNTVTVTLLNRTGAAVDLAAATVAVAGYKNFNVR